MTTEAKVQEWTLHKDAWGVMLVCWGGEDNWCGKNGYTEHIIVVPAAALAAAEKSLEDARWAIGDADRIGREALAAAEARADDMENRAYSIGERWAEDKLKLVTAGARIAELDERILSWVADADRLARENERMRAVVESAQTLIENWDTLFSRKNEHAVNLRAALAALDAAKEEKP